MGTRARIGSESPPVQANHSDNHTSCVMICRRLCDVCPLFSSLIAVLVDKAPLFVDTQSSLSPNHAHTCPVLLSLCLS